MSSAYASASPAAVASEPARWRCPECGWSYDEAQGDRDEGFAPNTRLESFPDDWSCPDCGVRDKRDFERDPEAHTACISNE
ncbi:MAG TPA: rubredoxin [Deltaproteobacteria bacterium]|nr:rubredoxin [Deltaproteobacteria bacterium]